MPLYLHDLSSERTNRVLCALGRGAILKQDFLKPILRGGRFEEHSLPLDVAKDFAAYEKLVVELAKEIYRRENPQRVRLPKGFAADFHLHIDQIEEGSTKPILVAIFAGALAMGNMESGYLERSRDAISECIASPGSTVPQTFPKKLLSHFNRIGRSLRKGESIVFPLPGDGQAVLTQDRRRALVLAADSQYEEDVEIRGTVEAADWTNKQFRLLTGDGQSVKMDLPESFNDEAGKFGGRHEHSVTVVGTGIYDSRGTLLRVKNIESLEPQRFYRLADRLDALAALEDGWLDGAGTAIDANSLFALRAKLTEVYPESLPLPVIVPTADSGVLLEWLTPGSPSVDFDLAANVAMVHAFSATGEDVFKEFDLGAQDSWAALVDHLQTIVARNA